MCGPMALSPYSRTFHPDLHALRARPRTDMEMSSVYAWPHCYSIRDTPTLSCVQFFGRSDDFYLTFAKLLGQTYDGVFPQPGTTK